MKNLYNDLVFNKSDILIPAKDIDMSKWSVIACDQYTSNKKYWDNLKNRIGDSPSTINLICPEAYTLQSDIDLSGLIHKNMRQYIDDNIFKEYKSSLIYTIRETSSGLFRSGIVGQIDLEKYDQDISKSELIKPTEKTDTNRLGTRQKIREGALLDLPHTILFYQDKQGVINKKLNNDLQDLTSIYNFKTLDTNQKLSGYLINESLKNEILKELNENLINHHSPLMVADGNHSLLSAKMVYEEYKKNNPDYLTSPLRYALVEIENLYDKEIDIKPIHRIIYNIDSEKFINNLKIFIESISREKQFNNETITVCVNDEKCIFSVPKVDNVTAVEIIQRYIDEYLSKHQGALDYVHESEEVLNIVKHDKNAVGILFDPIEKDTISKRISGNQIFGRKTFSIGQATDKRYYVESRKLLN